MEATQFLSLNFSLEENNNVLPKNIYGLRLFNKKTNELISLLVEHNGYCPNISTEREQSNYNDYLSNLEVSVIKEYCKSNNIKNPEVLSRKLEIMTDNNGDLFHYSRTIN